MKKLFFFFAVLFVFMTVGCNTEEKETTNVKIEQDSELIANLKNLNAELLANSVTTRAWNWSLLYHDFKCARSGARLGSRIGGFFGPNGVVIGFVAGGLLVGAAGSYAASMDAQMFHPNDDDHYTLTIDELYNNQVIVFEAAICLSEDDLSKIKENAGVNINFPDGYENLDNLGAMHNGVLDNINSGTMDGTVSEGTGGGGHIWDIFGDNPQVGGGGSGGMVIVDANTGEQMPIVDSTVLHIVKSSEFKTEYQNILYETIEEVGLAQNLNIHEEPQIENDDDPIVKAVLELFKEVYTTYPEKMEDYDYLINRYIEMIEASNEISKEDKETFYAGFSVAAYTARYWNK